MSSGGYDIPVPADRVSTTLTEPVGPGLLTGVSCVSDGSSYIFPQTLWATIAVSIDVTGRHALRLPLASGYINENDPLQWTGRLYLPPSSYIILTAQSTLTNTLRLMAWTETGPAFTTQPGAPNV